LNDIDDRLEDNRTELEGYEIRLDNQDSLIADLQAQISGLQGAVQSETDFAYADLFSAIINVDEQGEVAIFGIKDFASKNIGAENLVVSGDIIGNLTGNVIGDVVSETVETKRLIINVDKKDSVDPTIGTGIIPAEADVVSIKSEAVADNSKIYITPIGSTDNQVVYVGNIEEGKGFEAKVDRIDSVKKKDINFNWWIIGSKEGSE